MTDAGSPKTAQRAGAEARRTAPEHLNGSAQPAPEKRWTDVAGGWLGIGTSPGALLIGAGISQRYGGSIPLVSIVTSFVLMFLLLWFQGSLGLKPPVGDGQNLTGITRLYFGKSMQRVVAALIALGMIGWFGFNVGLGGAALSALLSLPVWAGALIIGLPVLFLSLRGMKSWNWLAALTTLAVLVLVGLVVYRLAPASSPVSLGLPQPGDMVADFAVFVGYISVFSVRAPDFTAGLKSRKDLAISNLLLCTPVILIALAGVGLQMGTGSSDLVTILASPEGLAIGNLLITIAVIAPTFTTLYSGAPALRGSLGIPEMPGMIAITGIGLTLAILRFDKMLLSWLTVLAAMLPPLVVPLAIESAWRRKGNPRRLIPVWVWLPGALVAMVLTYFKVPLAPLLGLLTGFVVAAFWHFTNRNTPPIQEPIPGD